LSNVSGREADTVHNIELIIGYVARSH